MEGRGGAAVRHFYTLRPSHLVSFVMSTKEELGGEDAILASRPPGAPRINTTTRSTLSLTILPAKGDLGGDDAGSASPPLISQDTRVTTPLLITFVLLVILGLISVIFRRRGSISPEKMM